MKLTKQQLEHIRAFISRHGCTTIDLQLEIIDHVACRMEEKLAENPTLGLEQIREVDDHATQQPSGVCTNLSLPNRVFIFGDF